MLHIQQQSTYGISPSTSATIGEWGRSPPSTFVIATCDAHAQPATNPLQSSTIISTTTTQSTDHEKHTETCNIYDYFPLGFGYSFFAFVIGVVLLFALYKTETNYIVGLFFLISSLFLCTCQCAIYCYLHPSPPEEDFGSDRSPIERSHRHSSTYSYNYRGGGGGGGGGGGDSGGGGGGGC